MKRRSGRKPIIVETRHSRSDYAAWIDYPDSSYSSRRGITYQLELVLCSKCRKRHGPYWYAYWWAGGRTRKRYVGKKFRELTPEDLAPRVVDDGKPGLR